MTDSRVKFIRLDNGDDLLAEVVEMEDDTTFIYHLINPLKVVYVPSEKTGYYHVAFMPWVFPRMVDAQEFTIDSSKVMTVNQASEKITEYYWENVNEYLAAIDDSVVEPIKEEESSLDTIEELMKRTYH